MIEAPTHAAREVAGDARGRTSSKFLADLTRAMRQAADESRAAALAQFQADVDRHLAAARETCEGAAAEARRCADEDISALGEWETAEIARIRRETEEGITARHLRLEAELAGQVERLDAEMTRVDASVNGFSAEIDAFFNGLLQHEDPALFAAMAEQLPEPPTFAPWSADTMDWQPEPEGAEATAVDIWTEAEAGAAEAAGQASGAADMLADPETLPSDPNAGMPAMQAGDFAAAEAEAAAWGTEPMTAEADASTSTEADDAASTSDANHTGPWPPVSDARPAATTATKTQVAVVGLVSVASIATFKRLLARVPGIHGVQVGSGPDGEFLFNATHDESVDIREAVTGIQGFEIEVTDSGAGIVAARATDPESV